MLGSGSQGNCTLIESRETTLLIDAGFSGKEVARRLALIGRKVEDLDLLLVTHEHNDHIAGVGVLSRRCGLPVYANAATHRACEHRVKKIRRCEFTTGERFTVRDLQIHPFSISHDTADPVGFVISDGDISVGYCTDTGIISRLIGYRLQQCQGLVLEANHDPEMLASGPYPYPLKQRVRSRQGHLANGDCAAFLRGVCGTSDLRHVVLAHLSKTNNTPALVMETMERQLGGMGKTFALHLADQDAPTELITLADR